MRTLLLILILLSLPATAQEGTQSMTGYIRALGPSIYMQGTHALESEDGKLLALLDSASVDLNRWLDQKVQVTGRAQASVEGHKTVLHVERVAASD